MLHSKMGGIVNFTVENHERNVTISHIGPGPVRYGSPGPRPPGGSRRVPACPPPGQARRGCGRRRRPARGTGTATDGGSDLSFFQGAGASIGTTFDAEHAAQLAQAARVDVAAEGGAPPEVLRAFEAGVRAAPSIAAVRTWCRWLRERARTARGMSGFVRSPRAPP